MIPLAAAELEGLDADTPKLGNLQGNVSWQTCRWWGIRGLAQADAVAT